jgi:hypothetical protein
MLPSERGFHQVDALTIGQTACEMKNKIGTLELLINFGNV